MDLRYEYINMSAKMLVCIFHVHKLDYVSMATDLRYVSSEIEFSRKGMFLFAGNSQGQRHLKKLVLELERPT